MNIKPFLENDDRVCHSAYKVDKIEDTYKFLIDNFKAKVIFELKQSVYFKGKTCLLKLNNGFVIKLIEDINE